MNLPKHVDEASTRLDAKRGSELPVTRQDIDDMLTIVGDLCAVLTRLIYTLPPPTRGTNL